MLSPASLRVCCLAVMAPALTKADRQADCLPVVLSESFCISKTPNTYSSQNHIGEIRAYSSEYAQHKRKPFMQRACWRTQKSGSGFLNKYRSIGFELSKSLQCSGKIRTLRDARLKSWQSINSTTAYAGKIKLKYTMNKNISNHKNMGLAKANTSLGLQSLKKMSQFSKENHNSGPNVMEDSLNFSDSVDSTVQVGPLISNIVISAKHLDSDILPVNNKELLYTNDTGRTVIENSVLDTTDELFVLSSVCKAVSESLLKDSLSVSVPVSDNFKENHNASVTLTDNLCNNVQNIESERVVSPIPCNLPNSKATDIVDANSDADEIQKLSATLESLTNESSFNILDHEESNILPLTDSAISLQPLVSKEPSFKFKKFVNLELPDIYTRHSFISLFPALTCSKLLLNASKLSYNEERWKCPVVTDCRYGLNYIIPARKEKRICCLPSNQELESLGTALSDKSPRVKSVLSKSTILLRRQINAYVRKQIGGLVEHYQRKYQIPCQRQTKQVNSKSGKELVDLKAELLQSEDVKSMSTAALVNLVRKLESNGSPQSQVLSPKSSINNLESTENACVEFEVDDYEDIKETSGIMLSHLKNMVKSTDPYFTDSSSEDHSEVEDDEESEQPTHNSSTLSKYLTARASLASSSTWLLARNHELEYRIKEYDERLSELIKAEGKVCLEEPVRLVSTENENVPTSVKVAPKKILPLNGCLSTMDPLHVAKSTNNESISSDLENSERTESDTEVEDTCCRTKPLDLSSFRKRKLTFIPGLHATNPKFSRLSSVHCYCKSETELSPCILCMGQYNSVQSIDPHTMPLRDRIAILDPNFHPALSTENDISLCLQLENYLKIEAAKYCNVLPTHIETNFENGGKHSVRPKFPHFGSSKLSEYARSLSEKYRNKHRKHYRKHKLVFGKWRRKNHRYSIRARTHRRRRRYLDASSDESSLDSPVHSPMSIYDDGFDRKRKDEGQFDIDDVILPCNSRSGRLEKLQYKDIAIPSWRCMDDEIVALDAEDTEETEDITESYLIKRHEILEVEEKERIKRAALGLNRRRRNRFDSRADSSGANTPDPTTLYNNQENVFGIPNFASIIEPLSPASPITNPAVLSDDSQPPFNSMQDEEKKITNFKQSEEESFNNHDSFEFDEVLPYEPHKFPLTAEIYDELLAEADHNRAVSESPPYSPDYASPESSTSSTSTVEEEDDLSDPEWTVVRQPKSGLEQALVLKFAKR